MLREYISPVMASLAPAGGKPSPCPNKGESDGAAAEPRDVTTAQVPAEPQGQSQPAAAAPVETKKYKVKSEHSGSKDKKGGPSQPTGESEVEIIAESLTSESLRNLQKDLARWGREAYTAWLLWVWDLIGIGMQLDSGEARNLGPLTQDSGVNQGEARDNRVYWTVWIRWPGTSEPQKYEALVDTGWQCTLMPSEHVGTEPISIAGVTGASQELTLLEAKAVRKSDGEWRLTVDYRALNEVTPPLSAAVLDMLEVQYELESKAAKWYTTLAIANAFFSNPLAAECRPQFAFTWRGVQDTWNRLPQGWKHSPTICHGLIQAALEKGEAPEHRQYINDIIVGGRRQWKCLRKERRLSRFSWKPVLPSRRTKSRDLPKRSSSWE
ncbi:hypothetical protein DUI87_20599 [Hirundo rustica rustica]|uniref:ribonuclease H n=1 Tax=Hirundo rustica rustica TaxID=333673 RepID=A0A3M0JQV4_HIRRU|nr:hypothetical protein DUI87_20599 [Hirundo rustica rustica]